jgi:hypothetical protein
MYLFYISVSTTIYRYREHPPITIAERSKAGTVFARSDAGIVSSNPTRGMNVHVSVYSVFVLFCV